MLSLNNQKKLTCQRGSSLSQIYSHCSRNISDIKVATAETELDMLLHSLNETKAPDSSVLRSPDVQSIQKDAVVAPMQHQRKIQDSLASITPNRDDDLDDLLKDTTTFIHFSQSSSSRADVGLFQFLVVYNITVSLTR